MTDTSQQTVPLDPTNTGAPVASAPPSPTSDVAAPASVQDAFLPATAPTDDSAPAVSSAPNPAGAPAPSPLDMLDQILADAQEKTKNTQNAEEEAQLQKQKEDEEKQRQIDAAQIVQEQAQIESMKDSPQYQAKMSHEQDVKTEQQQNAQEMTGMEILQLKHDKL